MGSLVFTLCSNNYLAHAKTLGDSILERNPDTQFVIGLVDKRDPSVDYAIFDRFELISWDELGFPVLDDMLSRYDIIEFNTGVKPFYIEHLFGRYPEVEKLFYIDPDIYFYGDLDELNGLLDEHDIVLTPHLTEPPGEVTTDELVAMRHGHFNLGFLGLRQSTNADDFVKWWQGRLETHCVIDKGRGLFVDQKWVDLAPLYFEGIHNFKHQGYNMAWWNTSERQLLVIDGEYFVNHEDQPLVFFHFSGFKPGSDAHFGRTRGDEYSFEAREDLRGLFDRYAERLMSNHYEKFWSLTPLLEFADHSTGDQKTVRRLFKSGLVRIQRVGTSLGKGAV